jgi:DNA invertase Pin-like site-specific DNA recombinase
VSRKRPLLIPYLRKSSGEDPAISRDRQQRAAASWAAIADVDLAPEVWEPGVSGSRSWRERGLGAAIDACQRGEADGIVVEEQSRLSRENGLATSEVWDALQNGGAPIRLVCVAEGMDTANGDQELSFAIRAALAREQWKQYARRIDHVKRRAIERGVHVAGTVPAGYRRPGRGQALERDGARADAIAAAFKMRAEGATIAAVCRMLDRRAPGGNRGRGAWTTQNVGRLLRNRVYLGEARQGRYVRPASHAALVDQKTFDTVQALADRNEPPQSLSTKSLLAGMVKCSGCGYALDRCELYGQGRRGRFQYRCRGRNSAGECPAPASIMAEHLDEFVLERVRERLASYSPAYERVPVAVDVDRIHARIAALREQLATWEHPSVLQRVGLEAWQNGVDEVQLELDAANAELAEAVPAEATDRAALLDALELFDDLSLEEQREVLSAECERVTVSRAVRRGRGIAVASRVAFTWSDGTTDGPIVESGVAAA